MIWSFHCLPESAWAEIAEQFWNIEKLQDKVNNMKLLTTMVTLYISSNLVEKRGKA